MELNVDLHIVNLNSEIIFNIVDQAENITQSIVHVQ